MWVSEEEAYHHHIHQIEQREDKDEEDTGEDDPADSRILQRTEYQDRLVFEKLIEGILVIPQSL
jgi:hypothetical protein